MSATSGPLLDESVSFAGRRFVPAPRLTYAQKAHLHDALRRASAALRVDLTRPDRVRALEDDALWTTLIALLNSPYMLALAAGVLVEVDDAGQPRAWSRAGAKSTRAFLAGLDAPEDVTRLHRQLLTVMAGFLRGLWHLEPPRHG